MCEKRASMMPVRLSCLTIFSKMKALVGDMGIRGSC
jgi:hypothetical protein